MQKVAAFLIISCLWVSTTSFLPVPAAKVNWMSVSEMHAAYARQPKPILVDVYTSWCGWCKVMDRETYSKTEVANYINEHFYPVKLDAESKDSFVWNNKTFLYNRQYKSNDLAIWLLYGQMSYPSTVFLPTLDGQPAPLAGYLKPAEMEAPLRYFGDGAYKTKKFPEFVKDFQPVWK
jgi:uncharacterized protein YyaL (SSP411 family)